jgi:putative DNA primase/helicase
MAEPSPQEREAWLRQVRARLAQEQESKGNGAAHKPTIEVIAGERPLAADRGMQALMTAGVKFYQRGVALVRVALVKAKNTDGEAFEVPGIVSVTDAFLGRALGQSANWRRFDKRSHKSVAIDPPPPVVKQILHMAGEWPFAPLSGIIQCPTLRRDGSLLATEGYDEATGLLLVSNVKLSTIGETRMDAEAALDLLDELLIEFPFVDGKDRSVALSMILTATLRAAFDVAPMHLVVAPRAGTGKSYLADVASMISTGDRCAVQAASPRAEETEKRLISAALSGSPIIALDNCRDLLEGDFLCQMTERPLLKLRPLGTSEQHRIPNTFTVFANGNNTRVANDVVRRTIRCALDANCEKPEERTFKSDPLAKIIADRGKYVTACLSIVCAYIAEGRPNKLPPLASYGGWSAAVREPLVWLGCADPVGTMQELHTEDPKAADQHAVFKAWKSAIGVDFDKHRRRATTKEVIQAAAPNTELREALLSVAGQRFGSDIDPTKLGQWLCRQENSIAGGCKLLVDRSDVARPRWYLVPQDSSVVSPPIPSAGDAPPM